MPLFQPAALDDDEAVPGVTGNVPSTPLMRTPGGAVRLIRSPVGMPPPESRLLAREVLTDVVVLQLAAAASMAAMMALLLLPLWPLCWLLPLLTLDALRLAADEDSAAVELTTADKISPNSVRPLRVATAAALVACTAAAATLQSEAVAPAAIAVLAVELRDMLVVIMAVYVASRGPVVA